MSNKICVDQDCFYMVNNTCNEGHENVDDCAYVVGDSDLRVSCDVWDCPVSKTGKCLHGHDPLLGCTDATLHGFPAKWAKLALQNVNAVILDTETTGLYDAEICEIAVISMAGNVLIDQRLHPIRAIESGAQRIHGLSAAVLQDEPRFGTIYDELKRVLESADTVIIYNAGFDVPVLENTCRIHGLEPIRFSAECAMLKYAEWYGEWNEYHGGWKWQKLVGGDHSALGDCRATLAAIKRMATKKSPMEFD